MQWVAAEETKKAGTGESREGLGGDDGNQVSHCHRRPGVEIREEQAGSKLQVDSNSSGKPKPVPQSYGKVEPEKQGSIQRIL